MPGALMYSLCGRGAKQLRVSPIYLSWYPTSLDEHGMPCNGQGIGCLLGFMKGRFWAWGRGEVWVWGGAVVGYLIYQEAIEMRKDEIG